MKHLDFTDPDDCAYARDMAREDAAVKRALCDCGEPLKQDGPDDDRGYCPRCERIDALSLTPPARFVAAVRW